MAQVVRFEDGLPRPASDDVSNPVAEPDLPLVLIEWRDAFFDYELKDIEDARDEYLVKTVGYLLREGPDFVTIAQEILADGEGFRAVTHIPVSIVQRTVLLEGS
jgi:hypothetical protein